MSIIERALRNVEIAQQRRIRDRVDDFLEANRLRRRFRRGGSEAARRAFYKYVCKIGWFSPMRKISLKEYCDNHGCENSGARIIVRRWDGDTGYYRPECEQYRAGCPPFNYNTAIRNAWHAASDEAFTKATLDHAEWLKAAAQGVGRHAFRREKRREAIDHGRLAYFEVFQYNFRGTDLELSDVPTCVLKLCADLTRLRTAIRKHQPPKPNEKHKRTTPNPFRRIRRAIAREHYCSESADNSQSRRQVSA